MSVSANQQTLLINKSFPLICDFCSKELVSISLVSKKIRELAMCLLLTQGISDTEKTQWEKTNLNNLRFPAPFSIALMSVEELREITFKNFRTLLGLIPETPIMPLDSSLGFHGTDCNSLQQIFTEKKSGKGDGGRPFLCIATYSHPATNKAHFLADLYLAAGKALGYGESLVIVKAPFAMRSLGISSYGQFILSDDHPTYKKFVSLFEARVSSGNLRESQLIVDPTNFSTVILGSLTTRYPRLLVNHCLRLSLTVERLNKGQLMSRLRIQEVLASAFQAMNILTQKSSEEMDMDTLNVLFQEQKSEEAQLTTDEEIDSETLFDIDW